MLSSILRRKHVVFRVLNKNPSLILMFFILPNERIGMAKTDTATKKSAKGTANGKKAATTKSNQKQPQDKKNSTSKENTEKKQRKEQAKQEAKLMLKLEQAKGDVQKAEQKLAKAQKGLEEAQTQQYTIQDRLSTLRTPHDASHNGSVAASSELVTDSAQTQIVQVPGDETLLTLETPFIIQSADITEDAAQTTDTTDSTTSDNTPATTSMEADQPPAEGRTDISDTTQEQNVAATTDEQQNTATDTSQGNTADSEGTQVGSDGVSMPIVSQDENAWPPPVIREEVAEAVQEEAASNAHEEDTDSPNTAESDAKATTEDMPVHSTTTHRRTRRTTHSES